MTLLMMMVVVVVVVAVVIITKRSDRTLVLQPMFSMYASRGRGGRGLETDYVIPATTVVVLSDVYSCENNMSTVVYGQ